MVFNHLIKTCASEATRLKAPTKARRELKSARFQAVARPVLLNALTLSGGTWRAPSQPWRHRSSSAPAPFSLRHREPAVIRAWVKLNHQGTVYQRFHFGYLCLTRTHNTRVQKGLRIAQIRRIPVGFGRWPSLWALSPPPPAGSVAPRQPPDATGRGLDEEGRRPSCLEPQKTREKGCRSHILLTHSPPALAP